MFLLTRQMPTCPYNSFLPQNYTKFSKQIISEALFLMNRKKQYFCRLKNKGVPSLSRQGEKAEIIPSNLIRIMPA
jgi:hypothetical protein